MPTQRFINLPDEKKERITQAIIYEFSVNGIDETDVADIVRRAEIPRGSFYQYFENKDEAIMHIINRIKDEKIAYLSDLLQNAGNMSFIDFYQSIFIKSLEFASNHPEYIPIGAYITTSKNKMIMEYINKGIQSYYPFYESLINKDKEKGLIRSDIDNSAIILLINSSTSDIAVKMMYEKHSALDEIKKVFDGVFDILRNGICNKEQ